MIVKPDFHFKARTTTYQTFSSDQHPPEKLTLPEFKSFKSLSKNKKILSFRKQIMVTLL